MTTIVTGAFGFLGKIICSYFSSEEVIRLGRKEGDIIVNLEDEIPQLPPCDLIIHAAGKAHIIPKNEIERNSFYKVNVHGTNNLLKGLEKNLVLPKYFVFISSVAVYGEEEGDLIDENYPLIATDPYGQSKIEAESLINGWCNKNEVTCTILRLPLLAGRNPPGNLRSMIKAISKGYYFNVGGGSARKSIVMVDDVAIFIKKNFSIGGIYNLTDGHHPSFKELSSVLAYQVHKRKPFSLPYGFIKLIALVGDIIGPNAPVNSKKLNKMTKSLTFSDFKARRVTEWKPESVIQRFYI